MVESNQEGFLGKSQPTYTREFKQQAVHLFQTSGKSKTEIARDLGISDSALSKWCKEFGEHGEEAFPGKSHQTAIEEENRKLRSFTHSPPLAGQDTDRDKSA